MTTKRAVFNHINSKNIVWNEQQTPVSIHFDDVYFSNDNAIAETQYVFIEGNHLPQRFINHNQPTLTIGETGFGSGLNFLLVWRAFLQFRQQYPDHILQTLQFYSVEKYPLSVDELAQIHQSIIEDQSLLLLADQLRAVWQCNHHQFGNVTLNILFADIEQYAQYLAQHHIAVDAWFLDGFSPAKNPAMWSADLFTDLHQLTAQQGTFATFTSAGFVKRNLISAGFSVSKRKGFGKKREMLIGVKQ